MSGTYGYFLIALCLVGTTANLLTLVILKRKNDKKKSTNWLLQAVAVVDSLYLVTRLSAVLCQFVACRYAEWLPLGVSQAFAVITPYVESSASLAHMISVWTVVVITVDRYIAVCLPGEVHLRTVHRAKLSVVCVIAASVCCCLPLFVELKTGRTLSPLDCDDARSVEVRSDRSSWFLIAFQVVCDCVLRTVIPFLVLVVLSSRMVVRLCQMTRYIRTCRCSRQRFYKKVNWRKRMTVTLVAVMALFTGCQLPQLSLRVGDLLQQFIPGLLLNNEALQQASNVASGLLIVNAASNFFVYCIVGTGFRQGLFTLVSANNTPAVRTEKCDVRRGNVWKTMTVSNHAHERQTFCQEDVPNLPNRFLVLFASK